MRAPGRTISRSWASAVGRQHDVGPALAGGDAARQVAQLVAGVQARRRVQVRGGRRGSVGVAPPREVAGRRRRVPDPLTAEPELPGDRREILLLGLEAQTRQRVAPQPDPPAVVRSRELDPCERCAGQRVARFPGLLPGEEDRSGQVGEEGEEGAQLRPPRVRRQGVEARPAGDGVAQPGLAGGEPRGRGERVPAALDEALQVEEQQGAVQPADQGPGGRLPAATRRTLQVENGTILAGGQCREAAKLRVGQRRRLGYRLRRRAAEEGGDARVRLVGAEQVGRDPLVRLDEPAEQGRGLLRAVLQQLDQPVPEQRRAGSEAQPGRDRGLEAGREQVEDQLHARAPLADVVLEVGVEPLVARIELRPEGDQQHVGVEARQREGAGQRVEPQLDAAPDAFRAPLLDRAGRARDRRPLGIPARPMRPAGRSCQQAVDLRVRDRHAAERVVRGLLPAQPCRPVLEQEIDLLQLGQQVLDGGGVARRRSRSPPRPPHGGLSRRRGGRGWRLGRGRGGYGRGRLVGVAGTVEDREGAGRASDRLLGAGRGGIARGGAP